MTRSAKPKRRRVRFSLRVLLLVETLLALGSVPISYRYRQRANSPDLYDSAWLELGPQHATQLGETESFYQELLDDARIRNLRPLRNSSDPQSWLKNHLVIQLPETRVHDKAIIHVRGWQREQIDRSELRELLATTIDVIRDDAAQSGGTVSVVGRMWSR